MHSGQFRNNPSFSRRAAVAALMGTPLIGRAHDLTGDITIGALLSLTGTWSTLGITSNALLNIAVSEMNAMFAGTGAKTRVHLQVEDTKLIPNFCVNSLARLAASGNALVIGPQSSAEAASILPMLGPAGVISISQGSTSSALSIPGDNLFRWVPDDTLEAKAVVALAQAAGVRTIVPCWRADAGNQGLASSVRRLFTAAGGAVTAGIEYSTDVPVFSNVVQQLSAQLSTAAGPAAIYLAAFDEIVDLFHTAAGIPGLSAVKWYGSDGVALSVPLESDAAAAAFAIKTGYVAPTLLRPTSARAKWEPLVATVTTSTGIEPDAFGLAAYDAAWCAMLARLLAGSGDIPTWKSYIPIAAEFFFGGTGWGRLNANGDRAFGDFDFFGLAYVNGAADWVSMAQYESGVVTQQKTGSNQPGRPPHRR